MLPRQTYTFDEFCTLTGKKPEWLAKPEHWMPLGGINVAHPKNPVKLVFPCTKAYRFAEPRSPLDKLKNPETDGPRNVDAPLFRRHQTAYNLSQFAELFGVSIPEAKRIIATEGILEREHTHAGNFWSIPLYAIVEALDTIYLRVWPYTGYGHTPGLSEPHNEPQSHPIDWPWILQRCKAIRGYSRTNPLNEDQSRALEDIERVCHENIYGISPRVLTG